jgi:hypothetical protein
MSLYTDCEIDEYNKINEEIKSIVLNKTVTKIDINNVNINDMVYICFYPNSQKYIYTLTPKIGKIISIEKNNLSKYNDEEENCINIEIINHKNKRQNLLHSGVSYMGHSLGYDYQIYLIE